MQLTRFLGIQMHATFVLKFGKCGLHMKQCNAMESCTMFMTFFPYFVILILIFGKHRLTVLLKEVIIHATLSYCRNMPFCGRARRGSRVPFPKEENARSRHQCLFVENVGKTEGNRS